MQKKALFLQCHKVVIAVKLIYGTGIGNDVMDGAELMESLLNTWILHESEAFICKALKGEAIVHYAELLITKGAVSAARRVMEASGSPAG